MLTITLAQFPEIKPLVQTLLREYHAMLAIDLEFQSFEKELAGLPSKYVAPRGGIALARVNGEAAGCICWYRFSEETCEIKRLFVRNSFRGHGAGKALLAYAIEQARHAGYQRIWLDSLERLKEAQKLYESFDFRPIPAYNVNPFPDVYYMELDLSTEPPKDNRAA